MVAEKVDVRLELLKERQPLHEIISQIGGMVRAVRVFARSRAQAPGINGISKVQGELRPPSLLEPKHGIEGAGVGLGPVGATDCQILLPAFRLGRHEAAGYVKSYKTGYFSVTP
jgi:hypothetical protein